MINDKRPVIADRAPATTTKLCLNNTAAGDQLAVAEHLSQYESVIDRGLQTFIEVGEALTAIREGRLYRQTHGTFDGYCRERWGWTSSRARQLMGAAETATIVALSGGTAPATESQARELAGLTPEQAAIVMRVAHERSGGNITAAAIRAARMQPWTEAEITTAIDGYLIHPVLTVLPAFSAQEWQPFAEDVGRHGLIHRISLSSDESTIIDGRFRYLALKWNGLDPRTATTEFGEPVMKPVGGWYAEEHVVSHIAAANLIRTHLTDDQKAMIIANAATAKAVAQ